MGCIVFVPCGVSTENHRVAISASSEQQKRMKFTAANVSEAEGEESAGNNDLSSTFPKIYLQLFSLVVVVLCMRGKPRPSLSPPLPQLRVPEWVPSNKGPFSANSNKSGNVLCEIHTINESETLPGGSITSIQVLP